MKKQILGAIVALSLFAPFAAFAQVTPAPIAEVHAGGFTQAQITAVVEMMQAFGVDQATINDVYAILVGA